MLKIRLACLLLTAFLLGCAEIEPPSPEKILAPWSGVPTARLGESKDSIKDKWGEPDEIRQLGTDEIGLAKEEWLYRGRYPDVPVDYKYLSKTKKLIFTGDNLTAYEIGEKPKDTSGDKTKTNNKE